VGAAILYGLHQVFTKLAAADAGPRLGGLVVEATAVVVIAAYAAGSFAVGRLDETIGVRGWVYSASTGLCVGFGTVLFFEMFRNGGPLFAVPAVLAGGSAVMAFSAMLVFGEAPRPTDVLGVALSIGAILCFRGG
jgi:transporter family protein